MEGLFHFLNAHGEKHLPIVADARGKREDNMLKQVFSRIMTNGTANLYQQDKLDADGFSKFYTPLEERRKQLEAEIPRSEAEVSK
jgi:hypothetical protein